MAFADILRSKTFTAPDIANLIEGIFVSGHPLAWTAWTPTLGATGSMTFTSTSIRYAKYIQVGKLVLVSIRVDGTTGGTASTGITATLPVTSASLGYDQYSGARVFSSAGEAGWVGVSDASTTATFYRYATNNYALGTASAAANFFYQAA